MLALGSEITTAPRILGSGVKGGARGVAIGRAAPARQGLIIGTLLGSLLVSGFHRAGRP